MEQKKSADGVLLVDKKTGITSHDVVERFRRRAKVKKAGRRGPLSRERGHAGPPPHLKAETSAEAVRTRGGLPN